MDQDLLVAVRDRSNPLRQLECQDLKGGMILVLDLVISFLDLGSRGTSH
jgi:hypothetical protein